MPKTHTFARHQSRDPVDVVLDKIESFEHDPFAYCTTIVMVSGQTIAVDDTPEQVRKIVNES